LQSMAIDFDQLSVNRREKFVQKFFFERMFVLDLEYGSNTSLL
jgi:hypothetical protein